MASSGSVRRDRRTPAPRCKRRRYRCSLRARPIRMSTVGLDTLLCCVLRIDLPTREQTNGDRAPRECDPAPVRHRPRTTSLLRLSEPRRIRYQWMIETTLRSRRSRYRLSNGTYCWYSFGTELR